MPFLEKGPIGGDICRVLLNTPASPQPGPHIVKQTGAGIGPTEQKKIPSDWEKKYVGEDSQRGANSSACAFESILKPGPLDT